LIGIDDACQHVDECGFASAVVSKDSHEFVGLDF
jgi:hypothetical protein